MLTDINGLKSNVNSRILYQVYFGKLVVWTDCINIYPIFPIFDSIIMKRYW